MRMGGGREGQAPFQRLQKNKKKKMKRKGRKRHK